MRIDLQRLAVLFAVLVPFGTLSYRAIQDHISIQGLQSDIAAIRYEIRNGRSRSHDDVVVLKQKVNRIENVLKKITEVKLK